MCSLADVQYTMKKLGELKGSRIQRSRGKFEGERGLRRERAKIWGTSQNKFQLKSNVIRFLRKLLLFSVRGGR